MKIPPIICRAVFSRRRFQDSRGSARHLHAPFSGKVVYIPDGDGFHVALGADTVQVRLFGMDAPERGQHYFQQSRSFLASQIGNKPVTCYPISKDPYGRLVCDCYGLPRFSLSLMSVFFGYSWHYWYFAPGESELYTAQKLARMHRRGLWMYPNPVEPWLFRIQQRKKGFRYAR